MNRDAKLSAIRDLAAYIADTLKDTVDLEYEDVLGMSVISIASVLQQKVDEREFREALKSAHGDFQRCAEYKAELQRNADPLAALISVIQRHIPKDGSAGRMKKIKSLTDLQRLVDDAATHHSDCDKCKAAAHKLRVQRTPQWFRERVGREPTVEEMRQVNCGCAGEPHHTICGVCTTCDMPFLLCTCV